MEKENISVITENQVTIINSKIFILFAEFLGFTSPLIDWAEDYCDLKSVPDFVPKVLDMDAWSIFEKMKKEYTLGEIRKWYDTYYPIILKQYEDKLNKRAANNGN